MIGEQLKMAEPPDLLLLEFQLPPGYISQEPAGILTVYCSSKKVAEQSLTVGETF